MGLFDKRQTTQETVVNKIKVTPRTFNAAKKDLESAETALSKAQERVNERRNMLDQMEVDRPSPAA
jgi:predicted dithiol-disulfide oxidoreductase (DUF899 family)